MRILFIDDLIEEIRAFSKALEREGHTVEKVTEPDEALKKLRTTSYDVLVLDIMMPPGSYIQHPDNKEGMITGILLLQDIRKEFPNIPAVVLTNVGRSEVLQPLYSMRKVKVLQKIEVGIDDGTLCRAID